MPLITDKAIKDTEICASVINEQRRLKKMMLDYLEIHYSDNLPITITHPMTYRSETIDIQTVKNDCAKQGCVEPLPLSHQLRLSALEKEQPRSYQRLNGSSKRTDKRLHRLNCPRITANQTLIDTKTRLQYRAEQNEVALAHERGLQLCLVRVLLSWLQRQK